MLKKNLISYISIFLIYCAGYSQSIKSLNLGKELPADSIAFVQLKTDSLFNSRQIISLMAFHKNSSDRFRFEFGYSKSDLKPTSLFAVSRNAVAAINGGFFDRDKGGSVSYFEINDTVISKTKPPRLKWSKPRSFFNGAIVLSKHNKVSIQKARSDHEYERSKEEAAVLLTGPLLLLNSQKIKLPATNFVKKRHPRTFFCTTNKYAVFITVDGRSKEAEGMSLIEAQEFLLNIGCVDAINLDGGGSTTMWTKDKGVVNFPSDKTGERPVSNVLFIMNK
ncbi:hypothetical protein C0389_06005 [bacterium]|nr:hypothetical protein [bacterium]